MRVWIRHLGLLALVGLTQPCSAAPQGLLIGEQSALYEAPVQQPLDLTDGEIAARAVATDPAPLGGVLGEWLLTPRPGRRMSPAAAKLVLRMSGVESLTHSEGEIQGAASPPDEPLSLWYRRPAAVWTEALPIGNGRLGGMVFGGVDGDRLQLNEGTLWAGGPYDPANPQAPAALAEVRRLIFEGKLAEANHIVGRRMMAHPLGQMPYQTLGNLLLEFPPATAVQDYRRDLNLDTAIATTTYAAGGVHFTREAFASVPDQVIAVRLTADAPGKISLTLRMKTPHKATVEIVADRTLVESGRNGDAAGIPGKLRFEAGVRVLNEGGTKTAEREAISVTGASSVVLLVAAATSYKRFDDTSGNPRTDVLARLDAAACRSYGAIRQAHVAEHQRLFRRVSLDLGHGDAGALPTDERIRGFAAGNDPQLAALYFQFGRYLLLSSSRPGGQPATLQGLWNDSTNPPWGSKYTININTEMNYWPAESCNLAECVEPLHAMVMDLTETGARTARTHWGARGWVAHHNTDLWRASAPIDGPWGFWPTGGAWLCQNLWEHYEYGRDPAYLARLYPALAGASRFFLDTLVEEPTRHWLVTCPSASPENSHPFGGQVCAGPTMDMQIIRDLFDHTIRAAEILGRDDDLRREIAAARPVGAEPGRQGRPASGVAG